VVRWLRDHGLDASVLATRWEGERDDVAVDADELGAGQSFAPGGAL
jgi:hypothetical protein